MDDDSMGVSTFVCFRSFWIGIQWFWNFLNAILWSVLLRFSVGIAYSVPTRTSRSCGLKKLLQLCKKGKFGISSFSFSVLDCLAFTSHEKIRKMCYTKKIPTKSCAGWTWTWTLNLLTHCWPVWCIEFNEIYLMQSSRQRWKKFFVLQFRWTRRVCVYEDETQHFIARQTILLLCVAVRNL